MAGLRMLRIVGNAELVSKEQAEAAARAEMEARQNEPYILGLASYIRECWEACLLYTSPSPRDNR